MACTGCEGTISIGTPGATINASMMHDETTRAAAERERGLER